MYVPCALLDSILKVYKYTYKRPAPYWWHGVSQPNFGFDGGGHSQADRERSIDDVYYS